MMEPTGNDEIEVRVLIALTYSMPADETEREHIYGSTDLGECVSIDIDNDAAMVFLDSDYQILDVTQHVTSSEEAV